MRSAGPNLHSSPTTLYDDQIKKHRMGMTRNTNGKYQQNMLSFRRKTFTPYSSCDQIEKNEMGAACSTYGEREEVYTRFWWGNLRKETTWKTQA
jgi:hypothetical protein